MKTHYSDFRVSFNLKVFWSLRQTQARGMMLHMVLWRLKSLKHIDHPHLNLNRLASLLLSNSYYKATILKWTSSQVFVKGFDYITVIAYDVLEFGNIIFETISQWLFLLSLNWRRYITKIQPNYKILYGGTV